MALDLRQGGLRSVVRPRRWDGPKATKTTATRIAECDLAASEAKVLEMSETSPYPRRAEPVGATLPRSAASNAQVTLTAQGGKPRVNVVWHKMSDLRLHDHEALARAHLETPRLPVVHLHVVEKFWFGKTRVGGFPKTGAVRCRFWMECVEDLKNALEARGQQLFVRHGTSPEAFQELSQSVEISKVFTFAEVCSEELALEAEVEETLRRVTLGAQLVRCWGYTLHHIDDLQDCGKPPERWITPYLTFGNFKREIAACKVRSVGEEWQKRGELMMQDPPVVSWQWGCVPSLAELGFSSEELAAAEGCREKSAIPWRGGESIALARLQQYVWERSALKQYVGTTDWTASGKCGAPNDQTSKLSPFLAFGCLSPRLLYGEILRFEKSNRGKGPKGLINSLLWRDFYRFIVYFAWGDRMYHLYGPMSCGSISGGHKVPTKWCCKHYNNLFGGSDPRLWTWEKDPSRFRRWAEGKTGYPFVDAAMTELKETGYMLHLNRETVGWFFVRDLQLDWRLAAEWFESRLLDYDCVLNWGNWAYFILTQLPAREDDRPGGGPRYTLPRYSPYLMATQVLDWGREHDPQGRYVKKWIPSLQALPADLCREPWKGCFFEDPNLFGAGTWTCASCTLENPVSKRQCDACLTRRPQISFKKLGEYGDLPMVPPPPDYEDLCGNCGTVEVGWASDSTFFCEACWSDWWMAQSVGTVSFEVTNPPISDVLDPTSGWVLVPTHVLPGKGPDEILKPKKGGRWAVKGERGDKLAGG